MTTQTISEKILSAHCGHPVPFERFAVALNCAVSPTAGAVPPTITEDTDGIALFSEHATNVQLCVFPTADAVMEQVCVQLGWRTDRVWHAYLPDARPGMFYGYRVFGPWRR